MATKAFREKKHGVPWKAVGLAGGALAAVVGLGLAIVLVVGDLGIRRALRMGRLANLPRSASQIQAGGSSSRYAATLYLRFVATPEDIERFIADSSGLKGVLPEQFGPEHMYLPYRMHASLGSQADRHAYFAELDPRYPWFDPTIRGRGRRYVIPPDDRGQRGEVVIDDERHVVFIKVWR
jgi:hypothetical protein